MLRGLENAKRCGQMARAEGFWCLRYEKRLVRKKRRKRPVNDVDACNQSLHATKSRFFMHNDPSLLLNLPHGSIERLDVLRVMPFE